MNFRKINAFLEDYILQISELEEYTHETYEEKMKMLYEIACCIYKEGCSYFKGVDTILLPEEKVTREETLELVLTYFKTVDSSFEKELCSALEEGSVRFTVGDEEKSEKYYSSSIAGVQDEKKFIYLILDETIKDAFTLVHEFSHYKNMGIEPFSPCYTFFTEGYAHMFETDFYFFLLKMKKYKEEAILYYDSLLLSLLYRSCAFTQEYAIFDTYYRYGKINNQTIYRTFRDDENPIDGYKMEMESLSLLLEKIDNPDVYFLEDGPYMIGLPFSFAVRKSFLKDRDTFLEEYNHLQDGKVESYYKKYVKNKDLKQLFRYGKR